MNPILSPFGVRRSSAAFVFVSFFGDGTAAAKKTKAASKRRTPKRGRRDSPQFAPGSSAGLLLNARGVFSNS